MPPLQLTPGELEAIERLARGETVAEVAAALTITPSGVSNALARAGDRNGCQTRAELFARYGADVALARGPAVSSQHRRTG